MNNTHKNSFSTAKPAGPCMMVIFGASGDLAKRKLLPSIYYLAQNKTLPKNFALVGFARSAMSHQQYRDKLSQDIKEFLTEPLDPQVWNWLLERSYYQSGEFDDAATYQKLKALMEEVQQRHATGGSALFYLSTLPQYFAAVVQQLAKVGLQQQSASTWRRVVVEKPFGRDLKSARDLNVELGKYLQEEQIYRIDHYLGKETVRNIMAMRFGNGIFEPIWNRRYIDHVQITVAEELGVEHRGPYYETAGALRDMVPNHICQLISLTAMEPPTSFDATAVRDEKAKLLHAVKILARDQVPHRAVRGQYGPGNMNGQAVPGYRQEDRVSPNSMVETYAALELHIDNWRWAGVPFYLRTGKRMAKRLTEVVIGFKLPPLLLFRNTAVESLSPNQLILRIQPDEGVSLTFGAKVPGPAVQLENVHMDFKYCDFFGYESSTGYETLLYDCMIGDATQFQRADMIEAGWAIVQPILDVWGEKIPVDFPNYMAGSAGPVAADLLLGREERMWRPLA